MSPQFTKSGRYGRYLANICLASDVIVLNVAYIATRAIFPDAGVFGQRTVWLLLNLILLLTGSWIGRGRFARSFTIERILRILVQEVAVHLLLFLSTMYFIEIGEMMVKAVATFYGLLFGGMLFVRILVRVLLNNVRARGYNYSTVVLVGGGPQAERLMHRMDEATTYGYKVVGVFGPEPPAGSPLLKYYRGPVDALEEFASNNQVDEFYYCSSRAVPAEVTKVAQTAEARLKQFYFVPQVPRQVLGSFRVTTVGSIPVLVLNESPLKSHLNAFIKRAFDIAVSGTFLIFFPLIYIPVAIAIKRSSPGPVFFKQSRTGRIGKEFQCYKFRTMKVNADSDKVQASAHDPRKTKVGEFLRHTSIDELPQFINVFKGDMSIVGPRPHMLKHTEEYSSLIDTYMVRHAVRPGITGWAQVNGYRGVTDELWKMEGRVEHDIWYIENWSFLLDLKIMAQTVINAVKGEENAF